MRIIDSNLGRWDDSMRLMSWKYAKTSEVGGSGVVLEFKYYIRIQIGIGFKYITIYLFKNYTALPKVSSTT